MRFDLELQQFLGVLAKELGSLGIGNIERIDRCDGIANDQFAALLVERTIGAEHHAISAEELDSALDGRA